MRSTFAGFRLITVIVLSGIILSACTLPASAPAATNTQDTFPSLAPNFSLSATPTQPTATASASATASLTPTASTKVSLAEPTLAITPGFPVAIPSKTAIAPSGLDCLLVMQSITNGTEMKPSENFSMGWKIRNTGTVNWNPSSVDFEYIGGSKLQQTDVVHLDKTVVPGDNILLTVEMRAPRKISGYSTFWSLRQGQDYFCRVELKILVR